ncbi:MAG: hypothetical protein QF535_22610 [Anaerolineales bacterium]|jgi:hypothetical protein|nr:hypothetical protein [Anaerolineales bacterium]
MTNEKTPQEKIREIQQARRAAKVDIRAKWQWIDWMCAYDWSVMGCLKFRHMDLGIWNDKWKEQQPSESKSEQTLNYYWHKIDRIFYGGRAERHNERMMRSVVLHKGVSNNNLHYHFVAYHPYYSALSLCQTLQEVWERKVIESNSRGRFEPVESTEAVLRYMTHEWGLLEQDTFSVLNLNLTNSNIWGKTNSESNMDDIRKRRLKIHSLTR